MKTTTVLEKLLTILSIVLCFDSYLFNVNKFLRGTKLYKNIQFRDHYITVCIKYFAKSII